MDKNKIAPLRVNEEKNRAEKDRIEKNRAEKDRIEKNRAKKARAEKNRAEKEKRRKARAEKDRIEKEKRRKARAEKDRIEKDRAKKARAEKNRAEKEKRRKANLKNIKYNEQDIGKAITRLNKLSNRVSTVGETRAGVLKRLKIVYGMVKDKNITEEFALLYLEAEKEFINSFICHKRGKAKVLALSKYLEANHYLVDKK